MRSFITCCVAVVLLGGTSQLLGCQGSSRAMSQVHQFDPAPRAQVGTPPKELAPRPVSRSNRPVVELLRAADKAYDAANKAQQRGNSEEALGHYTRMLELLAEANMDPSVFSSLRNEFSSLLEQEDVQFFAHQPRYQRPPDADGYHALNIPFPLPERVLSEIEQIQKRYPRSFQIGLNRSQKYLPYIHEQLDKAGMPRDLAWIVMVESQFNEKIDSPAGAGGMWQFMKATGSRYHLRTDSYVDERYNWQSATHAAIGYLKHLYEFFDGDWPLAIAGYNMGEYGLQRAIDATGGERDFFRLIDTPPASNRIKEETKKYYPRFLATAIVARDPERYGFEVNPQQPEDCVRVPVTGVYALADLEKALECAPGTLVRLNPDLLHEVTPPGATYHIRVPRERQEIFMAALSQVPQTTPGRQRPAAPAEPAAPQTVLAAQSSHQHTVRRGETLSAIARRNNVSTQELVRVNNIRSASRLRAGQVLQIPGTARESAPEVVLAANPAPANVGGNARAQAAAEVAAKRYTVRRGDTLYVIAQRHRVSIADLQRWNNLGKNSRIHPGATLLVSEPGSAGASQAPATTVQASVAERVHEVRAGEYPGKIASDYGVAVNDLLAWNNLNRDSTLRIGDKLVIRGGTAGAATQAAVAAAPDRVHEVRSGEFLSKIASDYGVSVRDLRTWNNLSSDNLRVGQKLSIQGGTQSATSSVVAASSPPATPAVAAKRVHEVRSGEFLGKIASDYGVSVRDLRAWNNLSSDSLRVGQKLSIQGGTQPAAAATTVASAAQAPAPAAPAPVKEEFHEVRSGEFLGKIASTYNVSVRDLRAWNSLSSDNLRVGQKLTIKRSPAQEAPAAATQVATQPAAPAPAAERVHEVRSGEFLGKIASDYGVSVRDLRAWNNLSSDNLRVGQKLSIQGGQGTPTATVASAQAPARAAERTYTVQAGDNPAKIAAAHQVSVDDLLAWNNLNRSSTLQIGDQLVLRSGSGQQRAASSEREGQAAQGARVTHVVAPGNNPTTIARHYGVRTSDLFEWNGWAQQHVLQVGDEVTIYRR